MLAMFYIESKHACMLNLKRIILSWNYSKYKKSKYGTELYWNFHHALIIHRKVLIWVYIPLAFTLVKVCPFPSSSTWTWISNSKSYRTYFFIKNNWRLTRNFKTCSFANYKKGALDSQVIKFTGCLPMVGGSHRVFRLLPPLKLVAMI